MNNLRYADKTQCTLANTGLLRPRPVPRLQLDYGGQRRSGVSIKQLDAIVARDLIYNGAYTSVMFTAGIVCPSVRPSVYLSVRLSASPSVRLSVRPSVCPSVRPSFHPSSIYPYLPVRLSVCTCIYLCRCKHLHRIILGSSSTSKWLQNVIQRETHKTRDC